MTRSVPQVVGYSAAGDARPPSSVRPILKKHLPNLDNYEPIYKHIHANPGLSFKEDETASLVVSHLKRYKSPAFTIKERIGTTGVAAILDNGSGPTVLLRADMDALPVEEKTGLEYASKKRQVDIEGVEQPVMHACGHDMHVTSLLAAAELLHSARDSWSGTLILLFQQAEEKGGGAQGMIDDGLYTRHGVPIPDVCLGGHVMPMLSGSLQVKSDTAMAASDSMEIVIHGRGGHASMPHTTIDPIVMAANVVTRLQTIVSREVDPLETAVVTVSSFHAGMAENIIVDEVRLKANVRTYNEDVRSRVLGAIKRIVEAEAQASGAEQKPDLEMLNSFPVTVNDRDVSAKVSSSFSDYFGSRFAVGEKPIPGSEDFSILGTSVNRPICFWFYGGVGEEEWKRREKEGTLSRLPSNHSAWFAPVIRPTLDTAVEALSLGALTWLVKKGNARVSQA